MDLPVHAGLFRLVSKRSPSLFAGLALSNWAQLALLGSVRLKKEPELNDHLVSITEHIPVEDHTALGQGQSGIAWAGPSTADQTGSVPWVTMMAWIF